MSKIIDKYSFNVPTFKTKWKSELDAGQKGGKCDRDCKSCIAYKKQCFGCDFLCPDRECKATNCYMCPFLCYRGGDRLNEAIDFIGGLHVDMKETTDKKFICNNKFIPAYNKKLPDGFDYPIVSIPFYSLFDFEECKPFSYDVKDHLNIPKDTKVIVNFYFKDDKIMILFDYMMQNKFIDLIKSYSGVDYWHTPCFSVFKISSGMDCVLNFKRQFWIGDIMRDAGFDVFQEVLYTTKKQFLKATPEQAIDIIVKKGIKKISQCGQLNFDPYGTFKREQKFISELPNDITWFITGLSQKMMDVYNNVRCNMVFSNYSTQFRFKTDFHEYIKTVDTSLRR